jgi:serine phosphatase RsbU (regulator of sigma subunit)
MYQDRATFPWAKSTMLAAPALVLVASAGAIGVRSQPGLILLALAAVYMFVNLVFLQPVADRSMSAPADTEAALEEFLKRADSFKSINDVAAELGRAIDQVSGDGATVALVAPQADGGIQVVSAAQQFMGVEIGDRSAAIIWLGDNEEPLWREELDGITDAGAIDTAELMDCLQARVLLPLRHRGNLLGLVLSTSAQLRRRDQREFLAGLRTHATTALANTFLDAEAQGREGMVKIFGRANAMQAALMPEELPVIRPKWRLRGLFQPVTDCGGDFWGWRELSDGKVLIVIADATGHGAGPALLSAVAKGTMDAHAQHKGAACDPSELLTALNAAILRVGQRVLMMTAFAVVIDVDKKEMRFANAGQNFPFLVREDKLEALVVRGDQLGASEKPQFVTKTKAIHPGDRILLYTDGIVEAGQPQNAGYGERRFRRLVQKMGEVDAAEIPTQILAAVEEWLDGGAIHDDVTMVAFEYASETAVKSASISPTLIGPADGTFPVDSQENPASSAAPRAPLPRLDTAKLPDLPSVKTPLPRAPKTGIKVAPAKKPDKEAVGAPIRVSTPAPAKPAAAKPAAAKPAAAKPAAAKPAAAKPAAAKPAAAKPAAAKPAAAKPAAAKPAAEPKATTEDDLDGGWGDE